VWFYNLCSNAFLIAFKGKRRKKKRRRRRDRGFV
jgi:hypothetical protein